MNHSIDNYTILKDYIKSSGLHNVYNTYLTSINGVHFDIVDGIQLVYIVEGEIFRISNTGKFRYTKGDIFLLNQNESRFLFNSTKENLCLFLNIHSEFLEDKPELYKVRFKNEFNLTRESDSLITDILLLYRKSTKGLSEDAQMKKLQDILKYILLNSIDVNCESKGLQEKREYIKSANKLILRQSIEDINLQLLADEMHLSRSYLSRIFKEIVNANFSEYMQQLKLYYACFYLLYTRDTMETISYNIGFESAKSLNRIFSRYLKISPSNYRKIYGELGDLNQYATKSFQNIFKEIDNRSYEFQNLYSHLQFSNNGPHLVDLNTKGRPIKNNWRVIKNLRVLGRNYNGVLDKINRNLKIDEIILNFKMKKDSSSFILLDLNLELETFEIYNILNRCISYNIVPIINLHLSEIDLNSKNYNEEIHRNIQIFEDFLDYISMAVGTTTMENFGYSINTTGLLKYKDRPEAIEVYRSYIAKQQRSIQEKLGKSDFKWGYELGPVNLDNLKSLLEIYEDILEARAGYRFKPDYVSLEYPLDLDFQGLDPEGSEKLDRYIKSIRSSLNDISNFLVPVVDRVYIRGLFNNIDFSQVPRSYRNLFFVNLVLNIYFSYEGSLEFIIDNSVQDLREANNIYHTSLIDNLGFFTPAYWLNTILDQLKGEIIYNQDGAIVIKNEHDIYILAFGDVAVDHLFSTRSKFENLESFKHRMSFQFKGLEGPYKITTETLSFKHGTSSYHFKDFSEFKYLTPKEKKYFEKISIPLLEISVQNISSKTSPYKDNLILSPFEIVLKKFIKL